MVLDPQILTAVGVFAGGVAALIEALRQTFLSDKRRSR
jgi:hypothetical protein